MSSRTGWNGKALSLLITWTLALSGVFAVVVALNPPVRAATCDQGGPLISGDWTITTAQDCSGILYTVDGSITINAGGSLTLTNGGLNFAKDASHMGYALTVNAGGSLILDNSVVTVERKAIAPFLDLAFTLSGSLEMRRGSVLQFPGWFNATGATITMTDSMITGFTPDDLIGVGVYTDAYDDGPVISWASTTARLYRSEISRIYENVTASGGGTVTGIIEGNISLASGSSLYAYDSYIAVDYSNVFGLHNELQVDATSNAYLYNVTINRLQDPSAQTDWQAAYVPLAAGGTVYLLRWMHATVVDRTGFPVAGATIWSALSPGATTAAYPDNGLSTTPSAATLAYLGKAASGTNAWNRTDSNGVAVIPLYTDRITTTSLPNADSFGNYQLVVSYSTSTAPGGVSFEPYPAVNLDDNNEWVTVPFNDLSVRTGPDLALRQSDYTTTIPAIQNQPFSFHALVYNQGQTTATDVSIAAYLDGNRSNEVVRVNGLTVVTFLDQVLNVDGIDASGPHTLELVVDPDNTVNEGGAAQESNNEANVAINLEAPPAGFTAILAPSANQLVEPGSTLSVTGYTRDTGATGIAGVTVTIELRSGSTVIGNPSQAVSDNNGFFIGSVAVPSDAQDGTYTVVVTPTISVIQPDSRSVVIQKPVPILNTPVPLIGLPLWMLLIIIAAVAAAVIGMTLYFKVYGLGKMVECGECGSFIPEDATVCPKCGVEFEKDMAKCSNCQAWIPVDVKECPECGVEFATGELDMANYQEKMRLQYDEVVQKFKEEAGRQLGRALNDREFQEWWRKQPTFVTFEDWLREEEDMRKMGSKACPVCGTLNSVTATVCHKCGSLMKELVRPPGGGGGGAVIAGAPTRRGAPRPTAVEQGPPGGAAAPPAAGGPPVVVQKKVIRRPPGEGEQSAAEGQTQGNREQDEL